MARTRQALTAVIPSKFCWVIPASSLLIKLRTETNSAKISLFLLLSICAQTACCHRRLKLYKLQLVWWVPVVYCSCLNLLSFPRWPNDWLHHECKLCMDNVAGLRCNHDLYRMLFHLRLYCTFMRLLASFFGNIITISCMLLYLYILLYCMRRL